MRVDEQVPAAKILEQLCTGAIGNVSQVSSSVDAASPNALASFMPTLARLHHQAIANGAAPPLSAAAASLGVVLAGDQQANLATAYAAVVAALRADDVDGWGATRMASAAPPPLHRVFEQSTPRDRACLVLHELARAQPNGLVSTSTKSTAVGFSEELFVNTIYERDLALILSNALANPQLASSCHIPTIVAHCAQVPVGPALLRSMVVNNLAIAEDILAALVSHVTAPRALTLPVWAQLCASCEAVASVAPAYANRLRQLLMAMSSVAAAAMALRLTSVIPGLQRSVSTFLFQSLKHEAMVMQATSTSSVIPLTTCCRLAMTSVSGSTSNGESEISTVASKPPPSTGVERIQEDISESFRRVRELLNQELVMACAALSSPTPSVKPSQRMAALQVYAILIVLTSLQPNDQEMVSILQSIDKLGKSVAAVVARGVDRNSFVSLVNVAYVLTLLLGYTVAPSLSKLPSQRDDITKAMFPLAKQCIYTLYSTHVACPAVIVSAVLLYTKSPALLPFLSSIASQSASSTWAQLRVEYFHVVGDVVLKPIITESLMARDVLTFSPVRSCSTASDHTLEEELMLRGIYGLLCEKSFLRYHHARKLEEWISTQIDQAQLPVHPLLVNILAEWIENYIVAFEYPIATRPMLQLAINPLRASFVAKALGAPCLRRPFDPNADASVKSEWAKAVVVAMYAIQFNQRMRVAQLMGSGTKLGSLQDTSQTAPLSTDICLAYALDSFPLRNMVREVLRHAGPNQVFSFVAPTLHRLVIEEFPHLVSFGVGAAMAEEFESLAVHWWRRKCALTVLVESPTTVASLAHPSQPSWMELSFYVQELEMSPSFALMEHFELLVDKVLPLAIVETSEGETSHGIVCEEFCAQMVRLYESRVRKEHVQLPHVQMKLIRALCFPRLMWKQQHHEQYQKQSGAIESTAKPPHQSHVLSYEQVLEEPFRILEDADAHVYEVPSLMRLLVGLVGEFRLASLVHLTKRDSAVMRPLMLQPSLVAAAPAPVSAAETSTAGKSVSIQQHILVQDCLLIHALINHLQPQVGDIPVSAEAMERNLCLLQLIDQIIAEHHSPHLIVAIHLQGYKSELLPLMVHHVPSLRLLWSHWLSQAPARPSSTSAGSGAAATPSGGSSGPSSSKLLSEFLTDAALENDIEKWQFHVQLVLLLCKTYLLPGHLQPVLQAMKQLWNKVRNVYANLANSSNTSGSHETSALGQFVRFLDIILPLAVETNTQNADLTAEFVQFLLKMQKQAQQTPANTTSTTSSPITLPSRKRPRRANGVEDAVNGAYKLLLQRL